MLNLILALLITILPNWAFSEQFVEGKDFEAVNQTAPPLTGKVNVTEFFSYGCPACYHLESALAQWVQKNQDHIEFSRIPVIFNQDWTFYAKAYYVAQSLNQENTLTPVIFEAIQVQKKPLTSNQAMIDFLISQGMDGAIVNSAFEHSTLIDMQINQTMNLMTDYHINRIPAIVVKNHYKTDLNMAQNEDRLFKILDFLVHK